MRCTAFVLMLLGLEAIARPRFAEAAYGSVTCCFASSIIDGAPPRPACIVLNVRARVRPRARARLVCRLVGGRPQPRAAH